MIYNNVSTVLPDVLVEHKISFAAENAELSIYDTYQYAEGVGLQSDQLMFCGMVSGKKIMHTPSESTSQPFLPHESFVLAPNKQVNIDFPDAQINEPTRCLAIEIAPTRIKAVEDQLNQSAPLQKELGEWSYRQDYLHTHHTTHTQQLLNRIVDIFTENHPDRGLMIDLAITELSARLLRHQTREFIVGYCDIDPQKNALVAVTHQILTQLSEPLDIDALARQACMCRTKFFEVFKQHFGCTPIVFQQQERLKKAAKLLTQGKQVTETCFDVGFANASHFSAAFKRFYGVTPTQFKSKQGMN